MSNVCTIVILCVTNGTKGINQLRYFISKALLGLIWYIKVHWGSFGVPSVSTGFSLGSLNELGRSLKIKPTMKRNVTRNEIFRLTYLINIFIIIATVFIVYIIGSNIFEMKQVRLDHPNLLNKEKKIQPININRHLNFQASYKQLTKLA